MTGGAGGAGDATGAGEGIGATGVAAAVTGAAITNGAGGAGGGTDTGAAVGAVAVLDNPRWMSASARWMRP